jgi:hypothetical protein
MNSPRYFAFADASAAMTKPRNPVLSARADLTFVDLGALVHVAMGRFPLRLRRNGVASAIGRVRQIGVRVRPRAMSRVLYYREHHHDDQVLASDALLRVRPDMLRARISRQKIALS